MKEIKKILENSGVICFPTETVYALACSANDTRAITKIYQLKKRNYNLPMSIMVHKITVIEDYISITERDKTFFIYYLPGPTTLIVNLKKNDYFPEQFFTQSIGIRIPGHPFALALLEEIQIPIVATSINISGSPPATKYKEISQYFKENIDLLFCNDKLTSGIASTVIDLTKNPAKIIRK